MKDSNKIILKPVITEQSMDCAAQGKYTFRVASDSNKFEIKDALEKIFKVKVMKVNIINISGKERRRGRIVGKTSSWKKAIVTLKKGDKIEIFEGV